MHWLFSATAVKDAIPIIAVYDRIKGTVLDENNFFLIIRFYAIMHRTTIIQKIILISICPCLFFCPANIYSPSLEKVQLGRPNPKLLQPLNFYLRRKEKDNSAQNCMHNNSMMPDF